MTPQTIIGLHSVGFEICRALISFDSGMCRPTPRNSVLCRTWFGLESVSGRPTYARYTTYLRPTNHLPSVAELRPTRPRTLPDKTDITPTYNRQFVGERSFRHVWKISPRQIFLPDHKPTPNRQNPINTDCKPISPRIWWFLSVWGRSRVGLAGVTGVLHCNINAREREDFYAKVNRTNGDHRRIEGKEKLLIYI